MTRTPKCRPCTHYPCSHTKSNILCRPICPSPLVYRRRLVPQAPARVQVVFFYHTLDILLPIHIHEKDAVRSLRPSCCRRGATAQRRCGCTCSPTAQRSGRRTRGRTTGWARCCPPCRARRPRARCTGRSAARRASCGRSRRTRSRSSRPRRSVLYVSIGEEDERWGGEKVGARLTLQNS